LENKLYIGNINFKTSEERLKEVFSGYGEVVSVKMITDHNTGRFRGFAFVEMATEEAARAAKAGLNGQDLDGRKLKVDVAQSRSTDVPRDTRGTQDAQPGG